MKEKCRSRDLSLEREEMELICPKFPGTLQGFPGELQCLGWNLGAGSSSPRASRKRTQFQSLLQPQPRTENFGKHHLQSFPQTESFTNLGASPILKPPGKTNGEGRRGKKWGSEGFPGNRTRKGRGFTEQTQCRRQSWSRCPLAARCGWRPPPRPSRTCSRSDGTHGPRPLRTGQLPPGNDGNVTKNASETMSCPRGALSTAESTSHH